MLKLMFGQKVIPLEVIKIGRNVEILVKVHILGVENYILHCIPICCIKLLSSLYAH